MKKLISVILIITVLACVFTPCVTATKNEEIRSNLETILSEEVSDKEVNKYPTGMLPYDDEELHLKWDNICNLISPEIWGDLDSDEKVTAHDARICLRAAAKLEELTSSQFFAADVFGTNYVNSMNARKILRVAANLDTFDSYTMTLSQGEGIVVKTPASDDPSYQWVSYVSVANGFGNTTDIAGEENEIGVILEKDENASPDYTAILSDTLGNYSVLFRLENEEHNVKNSFAIKIKVCADTHIQLNVGESYRLPDLWNTNGIPSEWVCQVNPESGLDVEIDIHSFTEFTTDEDGEPLMGLVPVVYRYTFTPQKKGIYEIEMIYKYTFNETPNEKFHFTIEVL